ncbi:hypothetical protein [Haliangium ochraceum]|uniref:hypothetical protein n=1 Tax=Haliangium ochraceum TaxID=80816 RepID=UPI00019B9604|nr:hypothetical protein [Haliangium ochraceum]
MADQDGSTLVALLRAHPDMAAEYLPRLVAELQDTEGGEVAIRHIDDILRERGSGGALCLLLAGSVAFS